MFFRHVSFRGFLPEKRLEVHVARLKMYFEALALSMKLLTAASYPRLVEFGYESPSLRNFSWFAHKRALQATKMSHTGFALPFCVA